MRNIVINGEVNLYYLISEDGKVFNIDGKEMTLFKTKNGYVRVKLSRGVKRGMYLVHRLVAETYINNDDMFPIVNHKNNIRHDNRVSNLEWCDNSYNQKQRFLNIRGTKSKPVIQYTLDGCFVKEWSTPKEVYEVLGIQAQNISKVCRGVRKQTGGFVWRYK